MMKTWCVTLFILCSSILSYGTTYYSQSSSAPTSTSNWNSERLGGGSSPSNFTSSNDEFVIQNGHTMTNTSTWTISCTNGKLQIESGGTLNAQATVDVVPSMTFQIDNGGTFIHDFSGEEIYDGTESFGATSTVELQTRPAATYDITSFGNLIINYSSGGSMRFDAGTSGTITVNGDLTITQTSNSNADEVRCATGSSTGVTLDVAGNLTMTGGTFNFYSASGGSGGTIDVGGDFLLTGGTWDNDGSDNLAVNFTTDNASSSISTNGVDMSGALPDVDFNVLADKTLTMTSNWEVGSGEIITVSGTLNMSTFNVNGDGTFTVNSSGTIGVGHASGIHSNSTNGNIQLPTSRRSINTGCTIVYNGTTAQITGTGLDALGTLTGTLQNSNTSDELTLSEDISFGDGFNLTIDESATLTIGSAENITKASGSSASITINGTLKTEDSDGFSSSSTSNSEALQGFTSCAFGSSGTVNYARSGSQTITNQFTYQNLSLSGSNNKTAAGPLDINGDLSVSGTATFVAGSNQINLAGSWSVGSSASFTEASSTVVFDGTGNHTITNSGGTETFDDVQFTSTGTYTLGSDVRLNSAHTLTISADCTVKTSTFELDGPSANLTMSNGTVNFEKTGTTQWPDFGGTISLSGGTIELGGAGDQVLNGGETYNNITFSGSGNKTLSSATANIDGTVFITESCTLDVSNSTFGGSGTDLTMDGGHFLIDGSGTKPDISGTYSLTGGTIEFSGSSSMTIRSPKTYFNILVSGTDVSASSGTYTLANGGSFVVNSGAKFSAGTRRILTGGIASVTINGTFETEDLDGFSGSGSTTIDNSIGTITLGSSSTIGYTASTGTQTITDRDDYANLALSGNASKTMSGTPEVSGNLTVSGGAATYPTTVSFDGTSTQQVPAVDFGSSTIVLSGGGDKELQGATTMNGTITFTSGNIVLGNNDLTLGSSAVVTSANSSSYIRVNGTGLVKQSIGNGSSATFPVGQNPYLPVTIEVTSGSGGEFSVGVEDGINSQPDGNGSALSVSAVLKTWTIETPSGANTATVTLQWNNSDQNANPGATNASNGVNMGFGLSNATSWTNEASASNASNPSSGIFSHSLSGISLTSSSSYRFGIGAGGTPLPVELVSFKGMFVSASSAQLDWTTAQEIDNSHFEVERSFDGINWVAIGEVAGSGNSSGPISYSFTDYSPELAIRRLAYYRLQQFDFDGSFEFSQEIAVSQNGLNNIGHPEILVFQRNEGTLLVKLRELPSYSDQSLFITDLSGKRVALLQNVQESNQLQLDHLPKGIYLIGIDGSVGLKPKKFYWY